MDELSRVRNWLEAGKQVGKSWSWVESGKTYWGSVGVQKWQGVYKIYVDKIEEARMSNLEDYDTDQIIETKCFEQIQHILTATCFINLVELIPQKGQKIFNPELD
ncbi:hypothetical protein [Hymenobacter actinosclerus]|uniref:hypothetical protein n=1 Tax=Hymenobacter actinosclerus TaxID=82805 RepID=UPI000B8893DA|nr:hypothetical protein [Hymenobacter actinosclerus]